MPVRRHHAPARQRVTNRYVFVSELEGICISALTRPVRTPRKWGDGGNQSVREPMIECVVATKYHAGRIDCVREIHEAVDRIFTLLEVGNESSFAKIRGGVQSWPALFLPGCAGCLSGQADSYYRHFSAGRRHRSACPNRRPETVGTPRSAGCG